MSDLRKQWAIVQQQPRPLSPAVARRIHEACKSVGIGGYAIDAAYAALVATLPRPIKVAKFDGGWGIVCRLRHDTLVSLFGIIPDLKPTPAEAYDDAIEHLHVGHGCPNRRTTGEPCDTACIHCHGWQWCAQPRERKEL